ncbi:hypothetical protein L208DRAFT_264920 [Tricholoma matsutake]|nr:hypothetical protein L208DRAFT_264920 [Tricholoma matsutake 945]
MMTLASPIPFGISWSSSYLASNHERRRFADRCWIISIPYARSNHIDHALWGSYQTIPLPGFTTPCSRRKARKLKSILAHPLRTPSSLPKHRLPHSKHYFLLSVKKRGPLLEDDTVPRRTPTRRQTDKNTPTWFPPVRYREQKNQFVLKITHDSRSLDNEITVLQKLRDANCLHIPEIVWTRGSGELGIVPIGEPVLPGEPAAVSRKIVRGMIDGLRYLHSRGIIHRDIRLSNLILKRERNDINVVIIDYETAFDSERNHSTGNEVDYSGGYICWPRRLLQSQEQAYVPEPADDLFAWNIRADDDQNPETLRVLQMWRDIESSKIWGQFYKAARDENYDGLLEISEVFSHV